MTDSSTTCTVNGCDRPSLSRGWCKAHYRRWQKHGDVKAHIPIGSLVTSGPCSIEGCNRTRHAHELCKTHYKRARNHQGDPLASLPVSAVAAPIAFDDLYTKGSDVQCWEWTGRTHRGYGVYYAPELGRAIGAHRYVYWRLTGEMSTRKWHVDHACHNPLCVNPAHLRKLTTKQNSENRAGPNVNNTSGHRNVSWCSERKKWRVHIRHNRTRYSGGQYANLDDAVAAAARLRARLFTASPV